MNAFAQTHDGLCAYYSLTSMWAVMGTWGVSMPLTYQGMYRTSMDLGTRFFEVFSLRRTARSVSEFGNPGNASGQAFGLCFDSGGGLRQCVR
jgi:hypothetical protein